MRTLEEVKKHVYELGYTNEAQLRIAGFLVGVGVKGEYEIIRFKNGVNEFSTFLHWFNDSPSDYFRRKDVFEDEFKNEKPKLKAKAYQDGKWFDVTFDEICGQLKKFNPVVCDGVIPDDILDKIFKEISGEEEPRYKYIGKERENLIKRKELLIDIIEDNEKKNKEIAIANPFISKMINFFNDSYKKEIKNIDDKLRETVD